MWVIESIVLLLRESRIAVESVVWAVPVRVEVRRALLKDLIATMRADNVVSQAEVLVQHKSAFWHPLETVLAANIARIRWLLIGKVSVLGAVSHGFGICGPYSKSVVPQLCVGSGVRKFGR